MATSRSRQRTCAPAATPPCRGWAMETSPHYPSPILQPTRAMSGRGWLPGFCCGRSTRRSACPRGSDAASPCSAPLTIPKPWDSTATLAFDTSPPATAEATCSTLMSTTRSRPTRALCRAKRPIRDPSAPHASRRRAAPASGPLRGGGRGAADTSAGMWKPRGGGGGGSRAAFANRPHQKARQCIGGPRRTLRATLGSSSFVAALAFRLPIWSHRRRLAGTTLRPPCPPLARPRARLRHDQRAGTTLRAAMPLLDSTASSGG